MPYLGHLHLHVKIISLLRWSLSDTDSVGVVQCEVCGSPLPPVKGKI